MNLLQIKQKMFELGVSDKYMADACGVGVYYLKGIFSGCRPMTRKLNQKIEHVFNTLMIKPKSSEQSAEPVEPPKPKYAVDETGKLVNTEKEKVERDIEFYRGKVGGLFHSLDIIREQVKVQAPDATYATGFVMMLLEIVKTLAMGANDLVDAFDLPIDVHGGITYGDYGLHNIVGQDRFVLGWDYNHYLDYSLLNTFQLDGKRWTTEEMLEDVKKN